MTPAGREGRNISFEVRWGTADVARIEAYAAELVKLNPDVILATNTPTARALKLATDQIPIVFAGLSDPIGDGIVTSLSKPGRNITGFTSFNAPIAGKWLELLKELSPPIAHVGVVYNPKTAPYSIFLPVLQEIGPRLGITVDAHAGERQGHDRGSDRRRSHASLIPGSSRCRMSS